MNNNDDTPYDTRTHNTVNEITALDPQGGVGSFNLDWGEGASKSGNLYILPDRTDPTNKADRFHYDYRNRLIKVEHSDDYGEGTPTWSTVVTHYYEELNRRVNKDLATGPDFRLEFRAGPCENGLWKWDRAQPFSGLSALGGEVTMTYNEDGTLATRTDQRKWKTTYTYDGQARVTQETVTAKQRRVR